MTNAVVALAASTVLGVLGTRPADYRYWKVWVPLPFWSAVIGMLALNWAAGLAGFAAVRAAVGHTSVQLAAGAAVAGHAVIRSQLDLRVTSGRSILLRVREWLTSWLDDRSVETVRELVHRLSDDELVETAFDIFWEFIYDPAALQAAPKKAAATEQLRMYYVEAAEALGSVGVDRQRGLSTLRGFCRREICGRRLLLQVG